MIGDTIEDTEVPDSNDNDIFDISDILLENENNPPPHGDDKFHDTNDSIPQHNNEWTAQPSKAPSKGKPPPTVTRFLDDTDHSWTKDIIKHIVDNDNTTILSINLVFENNNILIQTITKDYNNIFLYQDINGYEKISEEIFVDNTQTHSCINTIGSIISNHTRQKYNHTEDLKHTTSYILNDNDLQHHDNNTIPNVSLVELILQSIKILITKVSTNYKLTHKFKTIVELIILSPT